MAASYTIYHKKQQEANSLKGLEEMLASRESH